MAGAPATPAARKVFVVGSLPVRVRPTPSLEFPERRWLQPGERIECDPNSRTEAAGHVWWQHAEGWSVERTLDGKTLYLTEVVQAAPAAPPVAPNIPPPAPPISPPAAPPPAPIAPVGVVSPPPIPAAPPPAPAPGPMPAAPATTRTFIVGGIPVRVRSIPSASGTLIRELPPGTVVVVEVNSRTEADGFVWWKHAEGWSVERRADNTGIFLLDPNAAPPAPAPAPAPAVKGAPDLNTLPLRGELFQRWPVELAQTEWWQYFGNNAFAFSIWAQGKRWYQYAQSLHGGVDFGNSSRAGILIYAGVTGTFEFHDRNFTLPNGLWVKVGDYTIIYGHCANPRQFRKGDPITPDTVMGEMQRPGQEHLHLEIRYKDTWIVNPLVFFPEAMQQAILAKFPPTARNGKWLKYFYEDPSWTRWTTPYDQPVLQRGGPVIGPHGPR
jgi:hypothetical protein